MVQMRSHTSMALQFLLFLVIIWHSQYFSTCFWFQSIGNSNLVYLISLTVALLSGSTCNICTMRLLTGDLAMWSGIGNTPPEMQTEKLMLHHYQMIVDYGQQICVISPIGDCWKCHRQGMMGQLRVILDWCFFTLSSTIILWAQYFWWSAKRLM